MRQDKVLNFQRGVGFFGEGVGVGKDRGDYVEIRRGERLEKVFWVRRLFEIFLFGLKWDFRVKVIFCIIFWIYMIVFFTEMGFFFIIFYVIGLRMELYVCVYMQRKVFEIIFIKNVISCDF